MRRRRGKWQTEYNEWKQQDLSGVEVVYQWADGVYVKAGLEKDKAALLIIIRALTNGSKTRRSTGIRFTLRQRLFYRPMVVGAPCKVYGQEVL